jgi:hypothetical protein
MSHPFEEGVAEKFSKLASIDVFRHASHQASPGATRPKTHAITTAVGNHV